MDENELIQFHERFLEIIRERDTLLRVLKSTGGARLSRAGKVFVTEALTRGERQSEIARLLGVTPAAISRYANTT